MRPSRLIVASLITGTAAAALIGPGAASATSKLTCTAKMSNSKPHQYSNTIVEIHPSASATATTTAHYKSTKTSHSGTTNSSGNVNITYAISRATVGYKVVVNVTVAKKGYTSGACSTSFTPSK